MAKTIQVALSPLLIIGAFCGLGFLEYPVGQPRLYLTCLYFLIAWSFYIYLYYYFLIYTNYATTNVYILSWTNIIIILSATLSMFVSLFRFQKLKTCLYKLSIVDDTMEVLGTSKEYRRLYKGTLQMTIGWILLTLLLNTCDSICLNIEYFSINSICIPFVTNHMFHVNALNGLIWGIILKYINSRFHKINEYILDLVKDDATCTIRGQNKLILGRRQSTKKQKKCTVQYIWIIMHVHLELSFISRELNEVFSIQMTLQMASYFAFFVELCSEAYTTYIDKENTLEHFLNKLLTYVWAVVYTTKLLALNHICQMICDKANETITILHKLSNDNSDKDLQEQILQFILQIKRRKVQFYGMGLFHFGYDFIRQFYATIATVLVIIIQMHVTSYDLSPYDGTIDEDSN